MELTRFAIFRRMLTTSKNPIRANSGRIKKRAHLRHALPGRDALHDRVRHRADGVEVVAACAIVPGEVLPVGAEEAAVEVLEQDVVPGSSQID